MKRNKKRFIRATQLVTFIFDYSIKIELGLRLGATYERSRIHRPIPKGFFPFRFRSRIADRAALSGARPSRSTPPPSPRFRYLGSPERRRQPLPSGAVMKRGRKPSGSFILTIYLAPRQQWSGATNWNRMVLGMSCEKFEERRVVLLKNKK